MVLNLRFFIQTIILASCVFLSSLSVAMEDEDNLDRNPDPSPQKLVKILPCVSNPIELLKLDALDRKELTGEGQIIGIIEYGGIKHVPPGLENKIINTLEGGDGESHVSLVSQVVASKIPEIGFARKAKIFLGAPETKTVNAGGEKIVLLNFADAIKWVVRNGANAINLSVQSTYKEERENVYSLLSSELESRKGKLAEDLLEGISYALDLGVPVFFSAGNDKEDFHNNPALKSIFKKIKYSSNSHLLFIVGGYDYSKNAIFEREDMFFAKHSGRASSGWTSNYFITGPYKVESFVPSTIKKRKEELRKFQYVCDVSPLKDVWMQEIKSEVNKISNETNRERFLFLLQKFEEHFSFEYSEKLQKIFKKLIHLSNKEGCLESEIKRFKSNFLSMILEFAEGKDYIDSNERSKIKSSHKGVPFIGDEIFEKYILHQNQTINQQQQAISFTKESIEGTSFTSPVVASVYLRLNQYATQIKSEQSVTLAPVEIALSMKATAFKKEAFEKNENPEWYGCGVVDGEAALALCEEIVEARRLFRDQEFKTGIQLWEKVFGKFGSFLPFNFYFEVLEGYKLSKEFKERENQNDHLRDFIDKLLKFYPQYYRGHHNDRLNAFLTYEIEKYDDCKNQLMSIIKKVNEKPRDYDIIETTLFRDPKISWVRGVFLPSSSRVRLWLKSFLSCERNPIEEYIFSDKVVFFENEKNKYKLSLDVRDGLSLLNDLTKKINIGWEKRDAFEKYENFSFLYDVKTLFETLKFVNVPDTLSTEIKANSEKAQKMYDMSNK